MKKDMIVQLHTSFEPCMQTETENGTTFWLARDLRELLGYERWENFSKVIDKARTSCNTSGYEVADHFLDSTKMVELGSGAQREIDDVNACYLIAHNGERSGIGFQPVEKKSIHRLEAYTTFSEMAYE